MRRLHDLAIEGSALEMHQIRYFLAVSETLNLTKAAAHCNVAQPSLTRAIKALENELGGELLRRERALSHLTELGRRMLPMLRQSYETALAAKAVAALIRQGKAASLSLVVSQTVALNPFIPALRELLRAFPGLQLKLSRGSGSEVVEYLKSGTAELGIAGPLSETWSRLDTFSLFEQPFALVVGQTHRLAGRNRADLKDLASETFLLNTGSEMVEELKTFLKANGVLVTHQVATQEDLLVLLKENLGVAIMPVGRMEMNGLCRVALTHLNLMRMVSVYTVAGRPRAIPCATLLNMLRAADWSRNAGTERCRRSH